jgi:predicted phosphate transport protein (TIGR00153 family)
MGFSLMPREDEYFNLFSSLSNSIQDASTALVDMFGDQPATFEAHSKKIKSFEHKCDEITHTITTKLNSSFITPFDREDIFTLTVALDDVCDYIDASARAVIMYNITDVTEHARHLAKVIQGLAMEMNAAVGMLKKPAGMNEHIVEIHRLENEADDTYFRAIGELFQNSADPMQVIKLKELYEILENATDRCESVANIIESIVLKHS